MLVLLWTYDRHPDKLCKYSLSSFWGEPPPLVPRPKLILDPSFLLWQHWTSFVVHR
uniref:Uncharacterized protein n=1 Tax=Arundo donax TaxID=35708 RepID=A0A0A9VDC8_ARUDO